MHSEDMTSPVSFKVNVLRLPQKGMAVKIDATEKQRQALAEAHGLESVERYHVDLLVGRWKRNGVKVSGTVSAEITQACVVTLEPLQSRIREDVEALYLPEDSKLGREGFNAGGEILLDVDGPDGPELFSGDTIDVGALAEEFFGLAIDPYPRKAGASASLEPLEDSAPIPDGPLQQKLRLLTRKS